MLPPNPPRPGLVNSDGVIRPCDISKSRFEPMLHEWCTMLSIRKNCLQLSDAVMPHLLSSLLGIQLLQLLLLRGEGRPGSRALWRRRSKPPSGSCCSQLLLLSQLHSATKIGTQEATTEAAPSSRHIHGVQLRQHLAKLLRRCIHQHLQLRRCEACIFPASYQSPDNPLQQGPYLASHGILTLDQKISKTSLGRPCNKGIGCHQPCRMLRLACACAA